MSKLFKVTATMDVGYQLFIRAENKEEAMEHPDLECNNIEYIDVELRV